MEENKIDKIIKEKFENRALTPSVSSWERMENMLDVQQSQTKKKRYYFIGIAASIVMLLGIFFGLTKNQMDEIKNPPTQEQIIVTVPEKKPTIKTDNVKDVEELVKEVSTDNAVASVTKKNKEFKMPQSSLKSLEKTESIIASNENSNSSIKNEVISIDNINNNASIKEPIKSNARIQVNSDDLLYAVTHSPEEVKEYYANLKLNRNDVLDSIKIKLKKSNLKINPEVILAEVERSIEDDTYQGNFRNNLGRRISTIIVAVANRNK